MSKVDEAVDAILSDHSERFDEMIMGLSREEIVNVSRRLWRATQGYILTALYLYYRANDQSGSDVVVSVCASDNFQAIKNKIPWCD